MNTLLTYDFVEEYVLNRLSDLFQSKYSYEDSFRKHSIDNLNLYRNIKKDFVTIKEESLYIRIKIRLAEAIPLVQIIVNKENHKLCRVYVSNDEKKLGNCFNINDEKIFDLINLSRSTISSISQDIIHIKNNEELNIPLSNLATELLLDSIEQKNKELKNQIKGTVVPTYYGFCLILTSDKNITTCRYRFEQEELKKHKSEHKDNILQVFINKSISIYIKKTDKT